MSLESTLRAKRDAGQKLLGIYVTAGVNEQWLDYVQAAIDGGADFIEIGLAFSDPIIDGPVIEAASQAALDRGVTTKSALDELSGRQFEVPIVAMTYFNVFYSLGLENAAQMLKQAGVSGTIVPDLPFDVQDKWQAAAEDNEIADVLLAAPSTSNSRLKEIAAISQGFIYAVGLMGVTGVRSELSATATDVAKRLRALTDKPVLVGVGISTPEQAREVSGASDGAIIGSAVMRMILEGGDPAEIEKFVRSVKTAIHAD